MKTNLITRLYLITALCIFSFYYGKDIYPNDKIIMYQNPAIKSSVTAHKTVTAKSGAVYDVHIISDNDGIIAKVELVFARDRNALIACINSCPQSPGHIDSQCALNCLGNYIDKDLNDPAVIAKIPIIFYLPLLGLKGKLEACLQNNTAEQCINNNINEIDNLLDKVLKYL